jgi:hypothetical protein
MEKDWYYLDSSGSHRGPASGASLTGSWAAPRADRSECTSSCCIVAPARCTPAALTYAM